MNTMTKEEMLALAHKIKQLREQHGMSQKELANKLGISRVAVTKYEKGESTPSRRLKQFADVFHVSTDYLLGNHDNNKPISEEQKAIGERINILRKKKKLDKAALAKIEAGKKENGKRRVIEKGGYPSKKEAYIAGVEAYNNFKHGNIGIISDKILVKDFLNIWLNNVVKFNVRPNSFANYISICKTRIYPYIGDICIQEFTPIRADTFMKTLLEKGYSHMTITGTRTLLKTAFTYAVYPAELITFNPFQYTKVPKSAPKNVITRRIVTRKELDNMEKSSPFYIPCLIMYHTGMRVGEVLGLRWRDIENNIIHVKYQLKKFSQGIMLSELKTESSYRDIPIGEELILTLCGHKEYQKVLSKNTSYVVQYVNDIDCICEASKSLITSEKIIEDFVCTRKNGKLLTYSALNNYLKKLGINAHSFRHTHTTLLVEAGAPLKGISARLGHKKISITQDVYTHVTEKIKNDTLSVFNRILNADK